MKRILSTICIVIALVAAMLVPASAYASPDKKVSGQMKFVDVAAVFVDDEPIDGYIVRTDKLIGDSTGGMESTGTVFIRTLIIHADGKFDVTGQMIGTAKIQGKTGGITYRITGTGSLPMNHISGEWVIVGGTGELAGVHGSGTFSGAPGDASDYSGKTRFDKK